MLKYSLDSNAVSDLIRANKEIVRHFNEAVDAGSILFIPSIVRYEVMRGLITGGKYGQIRRFNEICELADYLAFDEKAAEKAVEIYVKLHKGKLIEDNDIYIAAISIVNDCTLVTANTRHFERVEGLNFVNWRD